MEDNLLSQEIVLFEKNEDEGKFIQITINEATHERVFIRGNANILTEEEYNSILNQLLNDYNADKYVIWTGDNDLGYKFAMVLQNKGMVGLLHYPGASLVGLKTGPLNFSTVRTLESINHSLDVLKLLPHFGLHSNKKSDNDDVIKEDGTSEEAIHFNENESPRF